MQSKKQLFQLFSDIAHLNDTAWGNHAGSYDANKAAALLIEEALESIGAYAPRELAREIVATRSTVASEPVTPVSAFDSLLDGLYIAIGELHKLGLTPHQMVDGLQIVHNANLQKLGAKDSEGKIIKPIGFVPPEERLQEILDNRVVK